MAYQTKENLSGATRKSAIVVMATIASSIISANSGVDEAIVKVGIPAETILIPAFVFLFNAVKGLLIHKVGLGRLKWIF